MLFWSKRSTAPSDDARSESCARRRRSVRSFAKSIRCSQSTAIVAPREAIFIALLPSSVGRGAAELFSNDKHARGAEIAAGADHTALVERRLGRSRADRVARD